MIQAAISALHATAPSWEATDWLQIAALYARAASAYDGSPVVTVNRAVAVGFADGPRAGLALLDAVGAATSGSRATSRCTRRGRSCCGSAGETTAADEAYARAIELSANEAERTALEAQAKSRGSFVMTASAPIASRRRMCSASSTVHT